MGQANSSSLAASQMRLEVKSVYHHVTDAKQRGRSFPWLIFGNPGSRDLLQLDFMVPSQERTCHLNMSPWREIDRL